MSINTKGLGWRQRHLLEFMQRHPQLLHSYQPCPPNRGVVQSLVDRGLITEIKETRQIVLVKGFNIPERTLKYET